MATEGRKEERTLLVVQKIRGERLLESAAVSLPVLQTVWQHLGKAWWNQAFEEHRGVLEVLKGLCALQWYGWFCCLKRRIDKILVVMCVLVRHAKQDEVMLKLVLHPHDVMWAVCRGSSWRNGVEVELHVKWGCEALCGNRYMMWHLWTAWQCSWWTGELLGRAWTRSADSRLLWKTRLDV